MTYTSFAKAVESLESFYGLRLFENKKKAWKNETYETREYNLVSPTGKILVGIGLSGIPGREIHGGSIAWILEQPQ